MAKSNRRPVDRLERQQRLERRHQVNEDGDFNADVRNWQQYSDMNDEMEDTLEPIAA